MSEAGYTKLNGLYIPHGTQRPARASFDSSQSGSQMAKRFAYADDLTANQEANDTVRTKVRSRARYEVNNSTYARGITLTIANDTIGTGPRLQFMSGNRSLNQQIETSFKEWSEEVRLPEHLRTMRLAKLVDGEALGEMVTNPEIKHRVKLGLALYEAEHLRSKYGVSNSNNHYDGIDYDQYANPTRYWLTEESVTNYGVVDMSKPQAHHADHIIHYFRIDRAGQRRGISEIQSALELFNMLRCYTKASLDAAETAANHVGLLYTNAPVNEAADDVEPFYEVAMSRNMMKALPFGWDLRQMKAEHPTTTYPQFKHEIINEIARCLNVPFNIAALNSQDYNYASGRLDHQTYFRSLEIEQAVIESVILNRIFRVWLREYSPQFGLTSLDQTPFRWYWDGRLHVDPEKEANAQQTRLENNTSTLAEEYARQGMDWEVALEQRAREMDKMKELGLTETTNEQKPSDSGEED